MISGPYNLLLFSLIKALSRTDIVSFLFHWDSYCVYLCVLAEATGPREASPPTSGGCQPLTVSVWLICAHGRTWVRPGLSFAGCAWKSTGLFRSWTAWLHWQPDTAVDCWLSSRTSSQASWSTGRVDLPSPLSHCRTSSWAYTSFYRAHECAPTVSYGTWINAEINRTGKTRQRYA